MQENSWELIIEDKYKLKNETNLIEIYGITDSTDGSTFSSFWFQGARSLHFFIRIKEISKDNSEILISTGGSETILGFDWGRNKKITKLLEEFCKKESEPYILLKT